MLIREIKAIASYDPVEEPNGYLISSYSQASGQQPYTGERAYTKISSIVGMPTNEVYTNGYITSIFIMNSSEPIFLLNLTQFAKGYSTTNVVVHSEHTGKGFAVPTYIAVSKQYRVPLYSFGTHTPAGDRIWQTLAKQFPDRVIGVKTKTWERIPYDQIQDGDVSTRAMLLPTSKTDK